MNSCSCGAAHHSADTQRFGRRIAQNASNGTGSLAYLLGGGVDGGRVVNGWPGLATPDLEMGEDLRIATDLRTVLAQILTSRLSATGPDTLFSGFTGPTSVSAFLG